MPEVSTSAQLYDGIFWEQRAGLQCYAWIPVIVKKTRPVTLVNFLQTDDARTPAAYLPLGRLKSRQLSSEADLREEQEKEKLQSCIFQNGCPDDLASSPESLVLANRSFWLPLVINQRHRPLNNRKTRCSYSTDKCCPVNRSTFFFFKNGNGFDWNWASRSRSFVFLFVFLLFRVSPFYNLQKHSALMHSLRKPMQVKDPVGDLAEKNA